MKFNKIKFISMLIIGSGFLVSSTFANADDLKVSNASKYDLSFSVNNVCSEEFGVVDNHSVKAISDTNFKKACAYDSNNCVAKVYNATSCTGKQIGTVVFDTNYGVQGLHPTGITMKGSGFNLFFEGPWEAQ
jgi:hypothetical protein